MTVVPDTDSLQRHLTKLIDLPNAHGTQLVSTKFDMIGICVEARIVLPLPNFETDCLQEKLPKSSLISFQDVIFDKTSTLNFAISLIKNISTPLQVHEVVGMD